jgi:hypothetical protein
MAFERAAASPAMVRSIEHQFRSPVRCRRPPLVRFAHLQLHALQLLMRKSLRRRTNHVRLSKVTGANDTRRALYFFRRAKIRCTRRACRSPLR